MRTSKGTSASTDGPGGAAKDWPQLEGTRGRAGGVIQEFDGPGGSDWLAVSEVGGAAGGWVAGKGAVPSPCLSPHRCLPGLPRHAFLSGSQTRCAQGPSQPSGPAFRSHFCGHIGMGPGASLKRSRCVRVSAPVSGSYPCSQACSRGRGGGQVLACASPLMPRPGAQIPASGGGRETPGPSTRPGPRLLRRAGQPEPGREREARPGSGSGFATCPGAPHPETQDLQVLLPQN